MGQFRIVLFSLLFATVASSVEFNQPTSLKNFIQTFVLDKAISNCQKKELRDTCGLCSSDRKVLKERSLLINSSYPETLPQFLDVTLSFKSNPVGCAEFRICDISGENTKLSAEHCARQEPLYDETGSRTMFHFGANANSANLRLKVPKNTNCSACVLQLKYDAGMHTGTSNVISTYDCALISTKGTRPRTRRQVDPLSVFGPNRPRTRFRFSDMPASRIPTAFTRRQGPADNAITVHHIITSSRSNEITESVSESENQQSVRVLTSRNGKINGSERRTSSKTSEVTENQTSSGESGNVVFLRNSDPTSGNTVIVQRGQRVIPLNANVQNAPRLVMNRAQTMIPVNANVQTVGRNVVNNGQAIVPTNVNLQNADRPVSSNRQTIPMNANIQTAGRNVLVNRQANIPEIVQTVQGNAIVNGGQIVPRNTVVSSAQRIVPAVMNIQPTQERQNIVYVNNDVRGPNVVNSASRLNVESAINIGSKEVNGNILPAANTNHRSFVNPQVLDVTVNAGKVNVKPGLDLTSQTANAEDNIQVLDVRKIGASASMNPGTNQLPSAATSNLYTVPIGQTEAEKRIRLSGPVGSFRNSNVIMSGVGVQEPSGGISDNLNSQGAAIVPTLVSASSSQNTVNAPPPINMPNGVPNVNTLNDRSANNIWTNVRGRTAVLPSISEIDIRAANNIDEMNMNENSIAIVGNPIADVNAVSVQRSRNVALSNPALGSATARTQQVGINSIHSNAEMQPDMRISQDTTGLLARVDSSNLASTRDRTLDLSKVAMGNTQQRNIDLSNVIIQHTPQDSPEIQANTLTIKAGENDANVAMVTKDEPPEPVLINAVNVVQPNLFDSNLLQDDILSDNIAKEADPKLVTIVTAGQQQTIGIKPASVNAINVLETARTAVEQRSDIRPVENQGSPKTHTGPFVTSWLSKTGFVNSATSGIVRSEPTVSSNIRLETNVNASTNVAAPHTKATGVNSFTVISANMPTNLYVSNDVSTPVPLEWYENGTYYGNESYYTNYTGEGNFSSYYNESMYPGYEYMYGNGTGMYPGYEYMYENGTIYRNYSYYNETLYPGNMTLLGNETGYFWNMTEPSVTPVTEQTTLATGISAVSRNIDPTNGGIVDVSALNRATTGLDPKRVDIVTQNTLVITPTLFPSSSGLTTPGPRTTTRRYSNVDFKHLRPGKISYLPDNKNNLDNFGGIPILHGKGQNRNAFNAETNTRILLDKTVGDVSNRQDATLMDNVNIASGPRGFTADRSAVNNIVPSVISKPVVVQSVVNRPKTLMSYPLNSDSVAIGRVDVNLMTNDKPFRRDESSITGGRGVEYKTLIYDIVRELRFVTEGSTKKNRIDISPAFDTGMDLVVVGMGRQGSGRQKIFGAPIRMEPNTVGPSIAEDVAISPNNEANFVKTDTAVDRINRRKYPGYELINMVNNNRNTKTTFDFFDRNKLHSNDFVNHVEDVKTNPSYNFTSNGKREAKVKTVWKSRGMINGANTTAYNGQLTYPDSDSRINFRGLPSIRPKQTDAAIYVRSSSNDIQTTDTFTDDRNNPWRLPTIRPKLIVTANGDKDFRTADSRGNIDSTPNSLTTSNTASTVDGNITSLSGTIDLSNVRPITSLKDNSLNRNDGLLQSTGTSPDYISSINRDIRIISDELNTIRQTTSPTVDSEISRTESAGTLNGTSLGSEVTVQNGNKGSGDAEIISTVMKNHPASTNLQNTSTVYKGSVLTNAQMKDISLQILNTLQTIVKELQLSRVLAVKRHDLLSKQLAGNGDSNSNTTTDRMQLNTDIGGFNLEQSIPAIERKIGNVKTLAQNLDAFHKRLNDPLSEAGSSPLWQVNPSLLSTGNSRHQRGTFGGRTDSQIGRFQTENLVTKEIARPWTKNKIGAGTLSRLFGLSPDYVLSNNNITDNVQNALVVDSSFGVGDVYTNNINKPTVSTTGHDSMVSFGSSSDNVYHSLFGIVDPNEQNITTSEFYAPVTSDQTGNMNELYLQNQLYDLSGVTEQQKEQIMRSLDDVYNRADITSSRNAAPFNSDPLIYLCPNGETFSCKALGSYTGIPGMEWWCFNHCKEGPGSCPKSKCQCTCNPQNSEMTQGVEDMPLDTLFDPKINADNNRTKTNTTAADPENSVQRKKMWKKVITLTLNGSKENAVQVNDKGPEIMVSKAPKIISDANANPRATNSGLMKNGQIIAAKRKAADSLAESLVLNGKPYLNVIDNRLVCRGKGKFENIEGIVDWCTTMCRQAMCPEYVCTCWA